MQENLYLSKIQRDWDKAKKMAQAIIYPQNVRNPPVVSDVIPFHPSIPSPLPVATNDKLTGLLNAKTATATDYRNYPLLEVDTVLHGDDFKVRMPQRPAQGQICVIDWLNVTMKSKSFETADTLPITNVVAWQNAIVKNISKFLQSILGFSVSHQLPNGKNFYDMCFELEHKAGLICIGGQSDTVLIMISGDGCTYAKTGWQADFHAFLEMQAIDPKITRVDLAHDDLYGDYTSLAWFARQYEIDGFTSHRKKPEIEMRGNWKRPNGKGRTLYIGTPKSSKYCRIYEKGKKFGDKNSNWLRTEVEFKSRSYFIELDVLINPSKYFLSAYPCFHVFDHQQKIESDFFERVEREKSISFTKAFAITQHQFGRYLYCFRKEFEKHGLDDKSLLDLLTDIENKQYPERLNALSIPNFFNTKPTN